MQIINLNHAGKQIIKLDVCGVYQINLLAEGSQAEVTGSFINKNAVSSLVQVEIVHRAPNTKASVTLKAVGYDQSFSRLVGRLIIQPDCPKAESFFTGRALLIGNQARAEIMPDLEIMSNDVQCSHATSISQVDPVQIFYLMSRGLTRAQAQDLLISGFLS